MSRRHGAGRLPVRAGTRTLAPAARRLIIGTALVGAYALVAGGPASTAAQAVHEEPALGAVGVAIGLAWPSNGIASAGPAGRAAARADSALADAVARGRAAFAVPSGVTALEVTCDAHALTISFAATLDRWGDALRTWSQALTEQRTRSPAGGPPDPAAGITPLANPAEEFDGLLRRARRAAAEPAPPCDLVTAEAAQAVASGVSNAADRPDAEPPPARSEPVRARVALHGAVDSAAAAALIASLFEAPRVPLGVAGGPAAARPRRLDLERATVSAWIGLAYPILDTPAPESLELLAFRIEEQLRARIGPEALFDVRAEVVRAGGNDWLEVRLLAHAEATAAVERAAREAVAAATVWALVPADFEALRARFRGARLRALATPEARAKETLLNPDYAPGGTGRAIAALRSADLEAAARTLGPPAVARLGPRAALDPSRGSP